jgi:diguanylate cyclase (GGDEF)-like protein
VRGAGAPADGVYAIRQDRQGTLWIGTAGAGLLRWRDGGFEALTREQGLPSNWIMALHEDADGSLWIGTNGEGLARLRNGRLVAIRPADGLWDGLVQVILEDRQGQLWFTGNRGFFRAARADLDAFADGRIGRVVSVGYGPGDALRASTFAGGVQPAGAVDGRGRLWLPSVKGLVIVDPQRLPDAAGPPLPAIDEVVVDGRADAPPARVVLPSGAVPLAIRYGAGTLLHAERVRFRYRLDGLHAGWVEAGPGREAVFAALPHGDYRFHLAASIDGQHWRESAAPLAITVPPRLTETAWFRGALALALLGAGALAWRLRTRHLQRRAAELARLVDERTEALRQANEHLSRLSFADALTGLPNRRRLDEVLDLEWRRAQRMGTPLAVVMADIDAFKAYNDSRGHPEADRCLAQVADVIRRATHRAGDFAARYGGEEFIVLLPGSDAAAAAAFGERLRQACEAAALPHPASPVAPVVTLSVGVASRVPAAGEAPMALVAEADAALYRAKQDGRNRVR